MALSIRATVQRKRLMYILRNSLMFLFVLAVSFTAGAQEIFKHVNEDGSVEYSDMPSPDAQEIEVDPNVVDVTPGKPESRSPERAEAAPEPRAPESDDTLVVDRGVDRSDVERQRAKRVAGEHKQNEGNDVVRPHPRQGGQKGGAAAGGHRR
jgi:hypothetical protein